MNLVLKIYGMSQDDWIRGPILAKKFLEEYPDRIGIYNGCVYSKEGYEALYVYRTKTSIVVRGSGG